MMALRSYFLMICIDIMYTCGRDYNCFGPGAEGKNKKEWAQGDHKGPAHEGPAHKGPAHEGTAHEGLAHKGPAHQPRPPQ